MFKRRQVTKNPTKGKQNMLLCFTSEILDCLSLTKYVLYFNKQRKRSNSFPEVADMASTKENAKSAGERSYSMTGRDLDSHKGSKDNDYKRAFGHEGSISRTRQVN